MPTSETDILAKLGKLRGYYRRKNKRGFSQKEIIMELAHGETLKELAGQQKRLAPIIFWRLIFLLFERFISLLDARILHRDIKSENILADIVENSLELIDFGFAKLMDKSRQDYRSDGHAGTPGYMAPEISEKLPDQIVSFSESTEIYSVARTIGNLLILYYNEKSKKFENKFDLEYQYNDKIFNVSIGNEIIEILNSLTHDLPHKRPTAKIALQQFKVLGEEKLDSISKVYMFGIVELSAFVNASEKKKQDMLELLQNIDEVVFADRKGEHATDYIALKRKFKREGLYVADKVIQYVSHDVDLPQAITEFAASAPRAKFQVNLPYFLLTLEQKHDLAFQLKLNKYGITGLPLYLSKRESDKWNYVEIYDRAMGMPVNPILLKKVLDKLVAERGRIHTKNEKKSKQTRLEKMNALDEAIDIVALGQLEGMSYAILVDRLSLLAKTMKAYKQSASACKTGKLALGTIFKILPVVIKDCGTQNDFDYKVRPTQLTSDPKPEKDTSLIVFLKAHRKIARRNAPGFIREHFKPLILNRKIKRSR